MPVSSFNTDSLLCKLIDLKLIDLLFHNFSSAIKVASAFGIQTKISFLQSRSCHIAFQVCKPFNVFYVNSFNWNLPFYHVANKCHCFFLSMFSSNPHRRHSSFSWFTNPYSFPSSFSIHLAYIVCKFQILNLIPWTEILCCPVLKCSRQRR